MEHLAFPMETRAFPIGNHTFLQGLPCHRIYLWTMSYILFRNAKKYDVIEFELSKNLDMAMS